MPKLLKFVVSECCLWYDGRWQVAVAAIRFYTNKSYSNRLKSLNLPTLKYRRHRGDMIELFKIIKGI